MTRVGRAVEKGETAGFMKVLADAESKQILGASLLGTGCDEVIHGILDLMYAKAPYTLLQRTMPIHPTVVGTASDTARRSAPAIDGHRRWRRARRVTSPREECPADNVRRSPSRNDERVEAKTAAIAVDGEDQL